MPTETDRIAAAIDETRTTEHWRDHDCRPDAKAFRSRGRVDPQIVRSQTRLRTAAWRNQMDRRRAPDAREIGMSAANQDRRRTAAPRYLVGALHKLSQRGAKGGLFGALSLGTGAGHRNARHHRDASGARLDEATSCIFDTATMEVD